MMLRRARQTPPLPILHFLGTGDLFDFCARRTPSLTGYCQAFSN